MIVTPYAGVECVPGAARAPDLVRGLSRAVHPAYTSVRRELLVLTFYIDDSEHQGQLGNDSGVVCLPGR